MDWQIRAAIEDHETWLGFCQPVGLVVAAPVLAELGVVIDRNMRPRQQALADLLDEEARLVDVRSLFTTLLEWRDDDLAEPPEALRKSLLELGVTLAPTWAVADPDGGWQLLVYVEPDGRELDAAMPEAVDGWTASPQARFERLLRETEVAAGLLVTPAAVRLVHAPKGETSGHVTFRMADMASVMGRPILAAFDLLLGENRLFRAPARERLPALLRASREAQNTVSTRLSRQVLAALHELLRGFVAADARASVRPGRFVDLARRDPQHVYGGLVGALMRLVFVLYAEDRDLMPAGAVYEQHYGVRGLFAKLRDDKARYGDMTDGRFGAWARLLALFRLIHRGGGRDGLSFTARRGRLFDPDVHPFLEGRERGDDPIGELPRVPDGTVWRILENLMLLDGERLTYRSLDVEQIGSVYETVMGFTVEVTPGRALALHTKAKHGAAAVVDLDALAGLAAKDRIRRLNDLDVRKPTAKETAALRAATDVPALAAALDAKVDRAATPRVVPAGTPVLQPTAERRRSGSHYTPRSLTQPIVAETLRPVLARLGPRPRPEQILDVRVLDPAMGSAAFLVEACRQLAEALVKAWEAHGIRPDLPPDEDALLHARRLVAQRCLYGVDRNAMAAELGKLSLWLATLARDHEFTFLDHCIRHGDSLVGLDRRQIEALHWDPGRAGAAPGLLRTLIRDRLADIEQERERIRGAVEDATEDDLRAILARAQDRLADPRLLGDAVVTAFFSGAKPREREAARVDVRSAVEMGGIGWQERLRPAVTALRAGTAGDPVVPFHWSLEFPEVFDRDGPGFDAIVGNPPFAGKNTIAAANHVHYPHWLQALHEGAHGNADLVAHFFRRGYGLLREGGCLGLIATNTIRQGDTRATGLRPIRQSGGTIYTVRRRIKWPGDAAVVVSVVHIAKGPVDGPYRIDGREVPTITAFLFHAGGDDDPARLAANAGKSFQGSIVLGMGFTFDDTDRTGTANPVALMHELIAREPRNAERIFPYIGGEEVNDSPTHAHRRWVINFEDFPLRHDDLGATWAGADARRRRDWLREGVVPLDYPEPVAADWPDLLAIVEEKVRPERERQNDKFGRLYWWRFLRTRPEMSEAIRSLPSLYALSRVGEKLGVATLPTGAVFADSIVVFATSGRAPFAALQSRLHEVWARFFASSMKDDLRYTPSDCFETFPFPDAVEADHRLEAAGERYHAFRADLMVRNDEGLTATYNRFHDPDERSAAILELRRLHAEMDRAVLDAYGWIDVPTDCVFELEWEDEDEEGAGGRRRKPWRYRWPEAVRDEVLARLLALNRARAEAEAAARRNRYE